MTAHVHETCGCGASIDYSGGMTLSAVTAWREEHKCSQPIPPGPCNHDSGITWPTGEVPRCELLAGHGGAHTWKRPNGGEAVWETTTHRPEESPDESL